MSEVFEGLIASVELINFMCHSHLVLNLNRQITVVAGRNGSGKSAVMIAIGLALGQRAQHLERGNSLKELIKSKESIAVVRVVLNNKGFKRDFFKDRIVVEKRISAKSSTTSVMNGERKVWSTKKDDLEMMLDFLSLRLDNPLNFLTQEQAKRFLNVSRPEMLYELFMRGTEIADVCQLNEESMKSAEAMTERIDGIEKELRALEKKTSEENHRLSMINCIKAMESELRALEEEILWARLSVKRKDMEESFKRFSEQAG
ncbi:Rad18-like recombination and DNA repair protein [Biomphalaria pfeifferi]|uniref:Rad18-like recombination and DNA repair protein n=1 Tax=Biomphalaria pfeifferi TaxID=112525 RepID=A0AAD8AMX0_BIOPF|nr:Rad18-like recombination and DNA repair protein [Biomphalaria pfeifferi]